MIGACQERAKKLGPADNDKGDGDCWKSVLTLLIVGAAQILCKRTKTRLDA